MLHSMYCLDVLPTAASCLRSFWKSAPLPALKFSAVRSAVVFAEVWPAIDGPKDGCPNPDALQARYREQPCARWDG
jgi:hypothetical protein